MATSCCEGEVVKSGYLTKSPSSGGRGRSRRRWFVLSSSRQDCHPASGNGASALSSSSRLDYYEKENFGRKGEQSVPMFYMIYYVGEDNRDSERKKEREREREVKGREYRRTRERECANTYLDIITDSCTRVDWSGGSVFDAWGSRPCLCSWR